MTAPPLRPPEPLMTISVAAKPGARCRDVLVDEATAEQLQRELALALEGIRAAKHAVAAMLTPRGQHPYPEADFCGKLYRLLSGEADWCAEPAGHEGDCGDQPRNQPLTAAIDSEAWRCAGCGCQCIGGRPEDSRCHDCANTALLSGLADDVLEDAAAQDDDEDDRPTALLACGDQLATDEIAIGEIAIGDTVTCPRPGHGETTVTSIMTAARFSVSDEVRAGMLADLRSRPGYPAGGGRTQTAAQRAMDEQQVDEAIAASGAEVSCSCGWTGPGRDSEAHRREHDAAQVSA